MTSSLLPPARPLGSVLTAMVTPFDDQGAVDYTAAANLATHLVDNGHDGLVISGTTGESPTTSDEEKDRLLRAVLEAVGDRSTIIAGVGTNDTHHTVELARSAEKAGAHAVLVVAPYYNKPPQEGVVQHFLAVAEATGLPNMLYDIPGRSGIEIAKDSLFRLAEHERIVAVKDAKGELFEASEVMAQTGLAFYSGDDDVNLAWLTLGAAGIVSVVGHAAGPQFRAMLSAVDSGDLTGALEIHRQLLPATRGIMKITQGAIMAKAALELQGVLPNRNMRLPHVSATEDQVAQLRAALSEAKLL